MTSNVLIIGAVWPESNSSAAGQNMAALIRHFIANDYTVHFATAAAESEHADHIESEHYTTHSITLNDSQFDVLAGQINPAIVVFDRFMTEEQFSSRVRQQCPDALLILNTEDLHSLRYARHEAVKQGKPASQACLNNTFSQREIAAILRCDLSLVISQPEWKLLTEFYQVPAKQLVISPLQQTLDATPSASADFATRSHFISIGNFRHAPNWDAVLQLKQLWPAIKSAVPEAQLHIYGAYPPKKATQLHNPKSGFLVKGWVDDVNRVMASARVCLAPLRFGAGIKGKLLTAILHATPSVTTAIGAEGIAAHQDWPGAVCDDTSSIVEQAVSLYTNPQRWQQASDRAEPVLTQFKRLQTDAVKALFDTISHVRQDLPGFRRSLFLQSLLWHHSLRASQFMSQWIEAKNAHKQ
ncbi:glycosyltransferase [Alteromonas gilva]|uniref:Glycosyltransferase family 4 protein n=1 Tax=Alteromonas gilva TaxID=2987522 RepID=A0ABT5L653_9ALTE|nr:glycosyltransferase family 4 protein [Alteromonas gilva]MDC8831322.1 glycosyltransferase family 4 protein [Alteromonas gilva]